MVKQDRRTRYTLTIIKDTFLALINEESFSKITVTQLCQRAEISRSTFYLHFNNLTDVLDAVLDDALELSNDHSQVVSKPTLSIDSLMKDESLLPACQRVGDSAKYRPLLMEPDLSEYIIGRIAVYERPHMLAGMKKMGISKEDAETLFWYTIHGSFAINRRHHFVKDAAWYRELQLLNQFTSAGYQRLAHK